MTMTITIRVTELELDLLKKKKEQGGVEGLLIRKKDRIWPEIM